MSNEEDRMLTMMTAKAMSVMTTLNMNGRESHADNDTMIMTIIIIIAV